MSKMVKMVGEGLSLGKQWCRPVCFKSTVLTVITSILGNASQCRFWLSRSGLCLGTWILNWLVRSSWSTLTLTDVWVNSCLLPCSPSLSLLLPLCSSHPDSEYWENQILPKGKPGSSSSNQIFSNCILLPSKMLWAFLQSEAANKGQLSLSLPAPPGALIS